MTAESVSDLWFVLDPSPLFIVDDAGRMVLCNPAASEALTEGQLVASGNRKLSFGSADCDSAFLAAVRAAAGTSAHSFLVLRQRHGGWVGARLHGVITQPLVIVALRSELAPTRQAMAAIGTAFRLTASEIEVLYCLLNGNCPKTVAINLSISEHTVRAHLRSLYAKMNVRGLNAVIRLSCTFL